MQSSHTTDKSSATLSILVTDDEESIRDLIQHWLTRAGHRVTCAASGDEARRHLRGGRFDLVITDIVMPDGDGFELVASVKSLQPHARILAISGGGKYIQGADCLKMARGLGADGIVIKPFNWEQVKEAIAAAFPDRLAAEA